MADLSYFDLHIKKKRKTGKKISFHPGKFYKLFRETVSVRKKCSMKLFALFNYHSA